MNLKEAQLIRTLYKIERKVAYPITLYTCNEEELKVKTGSILTTESEVEYEINLMDLLLAAYCCDVPILLVGGTGEGKTYSVKTFSYILFGNEGYVGMRCSSGTLQFNPLQPFITSRIENGIPIIEPDVEKCRRVQAIFIDELNRAETNQLLQLIDGNVEIGGTTVEIGVKINEKEIKKPLIVGAMNPPTPGYTETVQLDQAVRNRFLQIEIPSIAQTAGPALSFYSQKLMELHLELLESLDYRGENWLKDVADLAKKINEKITFQYGALKMVDIVVQAVSGDYFKQFEREKEIVKQISSEIGRDVYFPSQLERGTEMKELEKIVNSFEEVPCSNRDVVYFTHLTKIIELIKYFKSLCRSSEERNKIRVTPETVAIAAIIYWNGKGGEDVTQLVKTAYVAYNKLCERFSSIAGMNREDLKREGILRPLIIEEGIKRGNLENVLNVWDAWKGVKEEPGSFSHLVLARTTATLALFTGFCKRMEREVQRILNKLRGRPLEAYKELGKIYYANEHLLPSIYSRLRIIFPC